MNDQNAISIIVKAEHSLERERTRHLARANWARTIEVEAKIEFARWLRGEIAKEAATPKPTITPTGVVVQ